MSESVIADFVAKFNSDRLNRSEPIKGRVLLSEKRLVLAVRDTDKLTIPLNSIHDIGVGHVPEELEGFFESTVSIVFQKQNSGFVAAIEGDDQTIQKFSQLLFKVVLNGTTTSLKHPARVGGRVMDTDFETAKVSLQPDVINFVRPDDTVTINLATVMNISRTRREIGGLDRSILEIGHTTSGRSMLTMVATESHRKLGLLGRYIRLEYSDLIAQLSNITLAPDEKQLLVALYSGAGEEGISLPQIIGLEQEAVTTMVDRLIEDGLVLETKTGMDLTPKGQIVVNRHLEEVNV